MNKAHIARVKSLVRKKTDIIPMTLSSIAKHEFIGKKLLYSMSKTEKAELKSFMDVCLYEMRKRKASDIDMGGKGSNGHIWLRVQGVKKPVDNFGSFTSDEYNIMIQNILTESQRRYLYQNKNIDFSYRFQDKNGINCINRADAYMDLDCIALNMRVISNEIISYISYGFHTNLTRTFSQEYAKDGLILITGITGSGKSATLDSIIDMNNQSVEAHIVIIASPVEFVHSSKRCIIRHREVGRDTKSFKHGAIEALRQDPDIIVIGEMRDTLTIMAALEVADSGHKVFSTMNTSSVIESINRIIAEVPSIEQEIVRFRLAEILRCVVSQKLIPSINGELVLAKEIMFMIPSIRAAIKNNKTGEIYQMMNEGSRYGMLTMEHDLKRLYFQGEINRKTAISFANNKQMMQKLL